MPRYLVEVTLPEAVAANRIADAVRSIGSHFATRADWRRKDGVCTGSMIVEAADRWGALGIVPPNMRAQAGAVEPSGGRYQLGRHFHQGKVCVAHGREKSGDCSQANDYKTSRAWPRTAGLGRDDRQHVRRPFIRAEPLDEFVAVTPAGAPALVAGDHHHRDWTVRDSYIPDSIAAVYRWRNARADFCYAPYGDNWRRTADRSCAP